MKCDQARERNNFIRSISIHNSSDSSEKNLEQQESPPSKLVEGNEGNQNWSKSPEIGKNPLDITKDSIEEIQKIIEEGEFKKSHKTIPELWNRNTERKRTFVSAGMIPPNRKISQLPKKAPYLVSRGRDGSSVPKTLSRGENQEMSEKFVGYKYGAGILLNHTHTFPRTRNEEEPLVEKNTHFSSYLAGNDNDDSNSLMDIPFKEDIHPITALKSKNETEYSGSVKNNSTFYSLDLAQDSFESTKTSHTLNTVTPSTEHQPSDSPIHNSIEELEKIMSASLFQKSLQINGESNRRKLAKKFVSYGKVPKPRPPHSINHKKESFLVSVDHPKSPRRLKFNEDQENSGKFVGYRYGEKYSVSSKSNPVIKGKTELKKVTEVKHLIGDNTMVGGSDGDNPNTVSKLENKLTSNHRTGRFQKLLAATPEPLENIDRFVKYKYDTDLENGHRKSSDKNLPLSFEVLYLKMHPNNTKKFVNYRYSDSNLNSATPGRVTWSHELWRREHYLNSDSGHSYTKNDITTPTVYQDKLTVETTTSTASFIELDSEHSALYNDTHISYNNDAEHQNKTVEHKLVKSESHFEEGKADPATEIMIPATPDPHEVLLNVTDENLTMINDDGILDITTDYSPIHFEEYSELLKFSWLENENHQLVNSSTFNETSIIEEMEKITATTYGPITETEPTSSIMDESVLPQLTNVVIPKNGYIQNEEITAGIGLLDVPDENLTMINGDVIFEITTDYSPIYFEEYSELLKSSWLENENHQLVNSSTFNETSIVEEMEKITATTFGPIIETKPISTIITDESILPQATNIEVPENGYIQNKEIAADNHSINQMNSTNKNIVEQISHTEKYVFNNTNDKHFINSSELDIYLTTSNDSVMHFSLPNDTIISEKSDHKDNHNEVFLIGDKSAIISTKDGLEGMNLNTTTIKSSMFEIIETVPEIIVTSTEDAISWINNDRIQSSVKEDDAVTESNTQENSFVTETVETNASIDTFSGETTFIITAFDSSFTDDPSTHSSTMKDNIGNETSDVCSGNNCFSSQIENTNVNDDNNSNKFLNEDNMTDEIPSANTYEVLNTIESANTSDERSLVESFAFSNFSTINFPELENKISQTEDPIMISAAPPVIMKFEPIYNMSKILEGVNAPVKSYNSSSPSENATFPAVMKESEPEIFTTRPLVQFKSDGVILIGHYSSIRNGRTLKSSALNKEKSLNDFRKNIRPVYIAEETTMNSKSFDASEKSFNDQSEITTSDVGVNRDLGNDDEDYFNNTRTENVFILYDSLRAQNNLTGGNAENSTENGTSAILSPSTEISDEMLTGSTMVNKVRNEPSVKTLLTQMPLMETGIKDSDLDEFNERKRRLPRSTEERKLTNSESLHLELVATETDYFLVTETPMNETDLSTNLPYDVEKDLYSLWDNSTGGFLSVSSQLNKTSQITETLDLQGRSFFISYILSLFILYPYNNYVLLDATIFLFLIPFRLFIVSYIPCADNIAIPNIMFHYICHSSFTCFTFIITNQSQYLSLLHVFIL